MFVSNFPCLFTEYLITLCSNSKLNIEMCSNTSKISVHQAYYTHSQTCPDGDCWLDVDNVTMAKLEAKCNGNRACVNYTVTDQFITFNGKETSADNLTLEYSCEEDHTLCKYLLYSPILC